MKKIIIVLFIIIYTLSIVGCTKENRVIERIDGSIKTYYKLEDGTWACDDHIYQYQLVTKGRMPNAACDSIFVYLSNFSDISFEQAWKAAGLSSNMDDYFSVKDAVLVDCSTK